jgi:hypothetical protein
MGSQQGRRNRGKDGLLADLLKDQANMVKERKERQGRNPRTGETITIAAKRDASFRPSEELTEKLAQAEKAPTPEEAL